MNPRVARVLATLFVVTAAGVCVSLGVWQLNRAGEKRAAHAKAAALLEQPAIEMGDCGATLEPGRRVRLRGAWDRERHILLSGRTQLGAAGVHLVTPLVLASGERVLVERGWLEAADSRIAHPEHWIEGEASVSGVAVRYPASRHVYDWVPLASERTGTALWSARALDSAQVAVHVPSPVANAYVLAGLTAGDTASARPGLVPLPFELQDSGERMHLSYAFQWFSFALIILGGAVALARRANRPAAR
jgi:surfeit locus 1 family protein